MQCDQHLGEFSADGLARIEPEHFRQLLGEGGGALRVAHLMQIHKYSFDNANRIESRVLEETLVLNRDHGIHQYGRDIGELHQAAFFAVLVEQAAEHSRLQIVFGTPSVIAQRDDALHLALHKLNHSRLGFEIRVGPWEYLDRVGSKMEPALTVLADILAVAAFAQHRGDLRWRSWVGNPNLYWRRVKQCRVRKRPGEQFLIAQFCVLVIKEAKCGDAEKGQDGC